jgi:hypothetical protein
MSNRNLVPVYLDQETGELIADFGFIGASAQYLKNAPGNIYNATGRKLYRGGVDLIKKTGEGFVYNGKSNVGNALINNAENIADTGIIGAAGLGAGGYYGGKKILDGRKRRKIAAQAQAAQEAKNKRYGGLGRYIR